MRFPWQQRKEKLNEVDAALQHAEEEYVQAEYNQAVAHDLSTWARERAANRLDVLLERAYKS